MSLLEFRSARPRFVAIAAIEQYTTSKSSWSKGSDMMLSTSWSGFESRWGYSLLPTLLICSWSGSFLFAGNLTETLIKSLMDTCAEAELSLLEFMFAEYREQCQTEVSC